MFKKVNLNLYKYVMTKLNKYDLISDCYDDTKCENCPFAKNDGCLLDEIIQDIDVIETKINDAIEKWNKGEK